MTDTLEIKPPPRYLTSQVAKEGLVALENHIDVLLDPVLVEKLRSIPFDYELAKPGKCGDCDCWCSSE